MSAATPVLVTGASGFLGAEIVAQLLARGETVRASVRDPKRKDAVAPLEALPGAAERLEIVRGDLLRSGDWPAAVAGARAVIHAASPYALQVRDPQAELVVPAVEGVAHVLGAAAKAPSVRRVVLTSSMAAVTDEPDPTKVLTEADWNAKSSLTRNPYYFSKVRAESSAWVFMETPRSFDLVTIQPYAVWGPSRIAALNPSNRILADLLGGRLPGIVALTWGVVDVRDAAAAHLAALDTPGASGRYLCTGHVISMRALVALLASIGAGGRLPRRALDGGLGLFATKALARLQGGGLGSYLQTHLGRTPRVDTSKIRRELGVRFRPLEETVRDAVADLARWGHIPAEFGARTAVGETAAAP